MDAVNTERLEVIRALLEKGNGTAVVMVNIIGRVYDQRPRRVQWHVEVSCPQSLNMVSKGSLRRRHHLDERVFPKVPLASTPEEAVELFWDAWVVALDKDGDLALAVGQAFYDGPGEFSRHVYRRSTKTGEWVLQ